MDSEVTQATKSGSLKKLRQVIKANNVDWKIKLKHGQTLLHVAAESGQAEIVKYIIKKKLIPVDSLDNASWTPLHAACYQGWMNVIIVLLKNEFKLKRKLKSEPSSENLNALKFDGLNSSPSASRSPSPANFRSNLVTSFFNSRESSPNLNANATSSPTSSPGPSGLTGKNRVAPPLSYLGRVKQSNLKFDSPIPTTNGSNSPGVDNNSQSPAPERSEKEKREIYSQVVRLLAGPKNQNILTSVNSSETPLHVAIQWGNLECVREFVYLLNEREKNPSDNHKSKNNRLHDTNIFLFGANGRLPHVIAAEAVKNLVKSKNAMSKSSESELIDREKIVDIIERETVKALLCEIKLKFRLNNHFQKIVADAAYTDSLGRTPRRVKSNKKQKDKDKGKAKANDKPTSSSPPTTNASLMTCSGDNISTLSRSGSQFNGGDSDRQERIDRDKKLACAFTALCKISLEDACILENATSGLLGPSSPETPIEPIINGANSPASSPIKAAMIIKNRKQSLEQFLKHKGSKPAYEDGGASPNIISYSSSPDRYNHNGDTSLIQEEFASSVYSFEPYPIVRQATMHEINSTESGDVILRGNSLLAYMLSEIVHLSIGHEFLYKYVLKPLSSMETLLGQCEVDPTRISCDSRRSSMQTSKESFPMAFGSDGNSKSLPNLTMPIPDPESSAKEPDAEALLQSRENLKQIVTNILTELSRAVKYIPGPFKRVCKILYKQTVKKFPEHGHNVLAGFLFLRWICPAIVMPSQFGFEWEVDEPKRRGRVLVAKILQVIANDTRFEKEEFMKWCNPFLSEFKSSMSNIYETIIKQRKRDEMWHLTNTKRGDDEFGDLDEFERDGHLNRRSTRYLDERQDSIELGEVMYWLTREERSMVELSRFTQGWVSNWRMEGSEVKLEQKDEDIIKDVQLVVELVDRRIGNMVDKFSKGSV
eukprot:TRINITY_DN18792_c0_g1_i1.p1 TRINITY_DN18792_c0_g1~~TRINITY_DN18792_c0_g1_i1.p1  ORF type:complete len:936 (+),score=174.51 TRINITY_DN18792_c0_g1_i1:105-2912(+)